MVFLEELRRSADDIAMRYRNQKMDTGGYEELVLTIKL